MREHARKVASTSPSTDRVAAPTTTTAPSVEASEPGLILQAKLQVGSADDPMEDEADKMAAEFVRWSGSSASEVSRQLDEDDVHRVAEESVDMMGSFEIAPETEQRISSASGGKPLPDREKFESFFNADLSAVRIHEGPEATDLNRSIAARAFTAGTDVFLGQGASTSDRELLAHELTHVVQQGAPVRRLASSTAETAVKELPDELKTEKDHKKVEDGKWFGGSAVADQRTAAVAAIVPDFATMLTDAGFGETPESMSEVIGSKFPKGPLLKTEQAELLKALSSFPEGCKWLGFAGLFPYPRAKAFLADHKYQAWLKLDAANRVWLSYIAWREMGTDPSVKGTPPFNLGRSMDGRDPATGGNEKADIDKAIDDDIKDSWMNTLATPGALDADTTSAIERGGAKSQGGGAMDEAKVQRNVSSASEVLKRVLVMLHAGLQVYDKGDGDFKAYEGSVVRALSHGGRVNIRIPQLASSEADPNELMKWLGLFNDEGKRKEQIGLAKRSFGTHHLAIGKNETGSDGNVKLGKFREQGGTGAAVKAKMGSTQMFGMNLAVGGLGKRDFNGDVILPDGAHGHLLIVYRAPELARDGGLEIGIETTGPHAASTVGYEHTAKSTEATANPESSFGGMKTDKVGDGSAAALGLAGRYKDDDERNRSDAASLARFVDLRQVNDGKWLAGLEEMRTLFDQLGEREGEAKQLETLVGERKAAGDLRPAAPDVAAEEARPVDQLEAILAETEPTADDDELAAFVGADRPSRKKNPLDDL